MSAAGVSMSHYQHKKSIGKRTLKECTSGKVDNFVLIDVDSDNLHDVIIIDVPESLKKKLKKPPARKIIDIDDDEDIADEASRVSGSSDGCCTMPMHRSNSGQKIGNDYSFDSEKNTPVNLSECKRTYSEKAGGRNRYGFNSESENGSSESDCSDCEFIEDSSGKLREQWEKASLTRKCDTCNAQSGTKNQAGTAGTSVPSPDFYSSSGRNNETKASELSDSASAAHVYNDRENLFASDADGGCSSLNDDVSNPLAGSTRAFPEQGPYSWKGTYAQCTYGLSKEECTSECPKKPPYVNVESDASPRCAYKECAEGPAMCNAGRDNHANFFQEMELNFMNEPCSYNREPSFDEQFDCDMTDDFVVKCPNLRPWLSGDADGCERMPSTIIDDELAESGSCITPTDRHPNSSEQEKFMSGYTSALNSELHNEQDHEGENTSCCEATRISSLLNHQSTKSGNKSHMVADICTCESSDASKLSEKNGFAYGLGTEISQNDIITDRQKIKETDEYKHAMEEERASRQRELKAQAREAQRLRRRKKAEIMRVLDMEKRQRERLEEVRETQKKDEENLNLKEKLRVQVRNELDQIETTCSDMSSLLRKLGIHVGGSLLPLQNEVKAAYKRALLKFHPDRASRADLRQQVEAEEKFKLICRMKERLSLVR